MPPSYRSRVLLFLIAAVVAACPLPAAWNLETVA